MLMELGIVRVHIDRLNERQLHAFALGLPLSRVHILEHSDCEGLVGNEFFEPTIFSIKFFDSSSIMNLHVTKTLSPIIYRVLFYADLSCEIHCLFTATKTFVHFYDLFFRELLILYPLLVWIDWMGWKLQLD